ncbi:PREDICTED: phosphatidate cytidylyltransferase 1-like [Priapulus caudatus]|uniref:Phosphatidate cytidylyltransferase n=1 Tax=Priapulus caudatus TaxID=37621 RepID=A0ABM1EVB9_PRICU|nr:PREDICTED: phosphatidate cytidylyltransferase 1-like [Priapulus caudatus]
MAYMFGFFFGKTPLIKLSPKKTWEGWLGGLVSTIAFGWVLAAVLVRYDYFTCPVDFSYRYLNMTCERTSTFTSVKFQFPAVMRVFLTTLHLPASMTLFPFQLHAVGMALFASIIGPFGGFFASGFKRAFKIKDFGDLIPGHGGMMDRFDCQLLMASYVHVYHYSFVRAADPKRLLQLVLAMPPEQQLQFFNTLKDRLLGDGTLKLTAQ